MFSYKADLIISSNDNLFSPWYGWKMTELAFSNNHSLTDWSAVDVVFECRSGQTKDYRLIFVASTLRIRKMCLSGATCNHGLLLQWGSYYNSNWSYCSSTKRTSSSHRKLTCFRHDTAEKIAHLALSNKHPSLYYYPILSESEFEPRSWRGVLSTTLCDEVCQWFAAGRWFVSGTPLSCTNRIDLHDTTDKLLSTVNQPTNLITLFCIILLKNNLHR